MEQETQMETVYYVETPYAANEEEIATSYIAVEGAEILENEEEEFGNDYVDPHDTETSHKSDIVNPDNPVVTEDVMIVNTETVENGAEISGIDQSELNVASEVIAPAAPVDRLTCRLCKKRFTKISNKQRHIRRVHHISRQNGTSIRCIECNVHFSQISKLRSHLTQEHNLAMSEETLRFPSMEGMFHIHNFYYFIFHIINIFVQEQFLL